MTFLISICTDMAALKASGAVDVESPYRGAIDGRSGAHVQYSADGSKSMIVITSLDGLEALAEMPFVTVTSYEEIFGYERQVEIDGELQFGEPTITTVPAHIPQVVIGYEDDPTRPIYVVERTVVETVRLVTDEDGNETEVPGRPTVEYITTDEIEGYHQKPVYGDGEEVPEQVVVTPNPIMEIVAGNAEIKALYDAIYDQSPVTDEEGNTHTPSKFFAVPGGCDVSHIL
jgi:hypothetical protein